MNYKKLLLICHIEKRTQGNEQVPLVDDRSSKSHYNVTPRDRSYLLNWRELGGNNLTYYPNSKVHPMTFLNKLSSIFNEAGVPEECRKGLALSCLRGTAADWGALKESTFTTFLDFENAFKNRFWSTDKQRDLFLDLCYGKCESGNRAEYFLNLAHQAGFLDEKIPEHKLVTMISKHFPPEIQRGIITSGMFTFDCVEDYLRKVDDTYGSGVNISRNNNQRRGNSNPGPGS